MTAMENSGMWVVTGANFKPSGEVSHYADLCVCSSELEAVDVIANLEACTVDGCVLVDGQVQWFTQYFFRESASGSTLQVAVASKADLERAELPF